MVMVEGPPGDTVVHFLATAFRVVGGKTEVLLMVPRHHLDTDESRFDTVAGSGNLAEHDMTRVAVLVPCQSDAQRLVVSRVPVAAARRCGTDLERRGTCRPHASHRHVVASYVEPSDLAPDEGTTQTVDVGRVDDIRLDARRIEFRGVDAAGSDTVGRERPGPDAAGIDVHGIDLGRRERAGVDARRTDVGQGVCRERAV